MRYHRCQVAFITLNLLFWLSDSVSAFTKNGFELDDAAIPAEQILSGGPPRDGIPAVDHPKFLKVDEVQFLNDEDRLLGVVIQGKARAYPIKILDWHEIVNDRIGDTPLVVTYCPLCGTGVAFHAEVAGKLLNFGVSGLLYNSDVLLYDRVTKSLWSQLLGKAVSGEMKGNRLSLIPLRHTTWKDWRSDHPNSLVLGTDTGHYRNYEHSPYGDYARSRSLYFSVSHRAPANYHPKEQVLGVAVDGQYKAYPFVELSRQGKPEFTDSLAGKSYRVKWNEAARSATLWSLDGVQQPAVTSFWFAWFTFHPETGVFTADVDQVVSSPTSESE